MNSLTLRQRLLILTLLPSALVAISLVSYFTFSAISSLKQELFQKGIAAVRYMAPVSEYGIIAGQQEGLHGLVQAALQQSGTKAAVIVGNKGRVMAVSGRVSLSAEQLRQLPNAPQQIAEGNQWLAFGAPVARSLDDADPLFDGEDHARSKAPEVIGAIFIEFDTSELNKQESQLLQRGLLLVFAGMLLLAALAVKIADTLARPLMNLATAVRRMSAGDFSVRVNNNSSGEIGILENGFNDMARHIEESHQSLQGRIEEATAQLAYQARHDTVTGLINRREFEHRLEKVLAAVQAGSDECAVLFIDLDRFKQINDTCGYLAGDELLRQMSLLFQGRLREGDVLARLGGDEFIILLHDCNRTQARQIAEEIGALAEAFRFVWQEKVFAIGTSIGITLITRKAREVSEVIAAADSACQQAKNAGRNHVCEQEIFNPNDFLPETGEWSTRIASALADHRLMIEAIPMLGLADESQPVHHVEMTARLSESGRPSVELPALIDAAERYDLAATIDRQLIDQAIAGLSRANQGERKLFCLVPLSRSSLTSRDSVAYIQASLAANGISGDGLCFLFSEDSLTHSTSLAMAFARETRKLGCAIGLEDFGGGLASFSHLRAIEPAFVKLSRNLTRDLQRNRTAASLLRAIREITFEQKIRSLVDGVDEPKNREVLKALGVDYVSGRAIAPREPFEVWLEGAVMR